MAILFVASGGSNTSPYDTWAKAATSLATAISASAAGDAIIIQYDAVPTSDAEMSGDTTYTFAAGTALVSASNDGGSSYTPTAMGTSYWIGNSTTSRGINISVTGVGRGKVFVWGVTFRLSASTAKSLSINSASSANGPYVFEDCYFWQGNTASTSYITLNTAGEIRLLRTTLRFGNTAQHLQVMGASIELVECEVSSAGSTPATLVNYSAFVSIANGIARFSGCDLSLVTGTLVGSSTSLTFRVFFERCRLGSGVSPLAAQTSLQGQSEVWLMDCASGDTHMEFGYYTGLGALTKDSAIYFTSGAAAASWKVVTTSYCGRFAPFVTPWVDLYNTGTSAITPYFEILRDGSTTAYKDHEVWAEFVVKNQSGYTDASDFMDRASVANYVAASGSNQAAGAGTGSWTGEGGSAWSGKIDSGSSLTPAEVGYIRGRMCFGVASATIYMDPQIRT